MHGRSGSQHGRPSHRRHGRGRRRTGHGNRDAPRVLRQWNLPCSAIAGAADSKLPDAQAGFEKALHVNTAIRDGANLVTQAAGMQAGLTGVSSLAQVIDNDMLGSILRANLPPDISVEALAIDAISSVVRG